MKIRARLGELRRLCRFVGAAVAFVIAVAFSGCAVSSGPGQASPPGVEASSECGAGPAGASAACGTHGPTGAPGGLSRDAAVAAARRLAPSSARQPTVVWASIESDPFARSGATSRPLVWEVRLEGPFAASPCPSGFLDRYPSPSDPACLDSESGLIVVIDYFTGQLVGWLH